MKVEIDIHRDRHDAKILVTTTNIAFNSVEFASLTTDDKVKLNTKVQELKAFIQDLFEK